MTHCQPTLYQLYLPHLHRGYSGDRTTGIENRQFCKSNVIVNIMYRNWRGSFDTDRFSKFAFQVAICSCIEILPFREWFQFSQTIAHRASFLASDGWWNCLKCLGELSWFSICHFVVCPVMQYEHYLLLTPKMTNNSRCNYPVSDKSMCHVWLPWVIHDFKFIGRSFMPLLYPMYR